VGHVRQDLVKYGEEALADLSMKGQEVDSDDSEVWQSCANYCTIMKAAMVALKEFSP
jgi:hypothetical protein